MADLAPCPDCCAPSWRPGVRFDEAVHCLAWHCAQHPEAPRKFVIACRDRTISKLRADLAYACSTTFGACCATAVAAYEGEIAGLRVKVDTLTINANRAIKALNG